MIAYKFLRADGSSVFTGFAWALPNGGPGPWIDAAGVDPCRSGIHACRLTDLPLWVGRVLYEIELDGPIREERTKVVAPRGRLVRRIDAWDDGLRDRYTRMCADRAHELARGHSPPLENWDAVVEPSFPEGPPCSVSWRHASPRKLRASRPITASARSRRAGSAPSSGSSQTPDEAANRSLRSQRERP